MGSSTTNWVHENGNVTEKDIIALAQAKRNEKKLSLKGFRWIKISNRLQVFVPCDKDGNPTRDGKKIIARYMKDT